MRRRPLTAAQRVALAVLPTVTLLLLAEMGARAYYFLSTGYDVRYLVAPFGGVRVPVVHVHEPKSTYTRFDPCSRRTITYTAHAIGRGAIPTVAKPPGTLRILAVGGSTTFGLNNPDHATWPAVLEVTLARRGMPVEVINAGQPGYQLDDFINLFSKELIKYQADIVLLYAAWNETHLPVASQVRHNVRRFTENTWIGRLAAWLYAKSMLYTYLLERTQFYFVTRSRESVVPQITHFSARLEQFIRLVRTHKATPVLILEVYDGRPARAVRGLSLEDHRALQHFILEAAEADARETYDRLTKIRLGQAQVLLEVVRRTGAAQGVTVIDPWPSFAGYQGTAPLFCGVDHLTDRGNEVLAEVVAGQLKSNLNGRTLQ